MRNGMVDFHTHILPGIDDGSRKTEESLELLRLERKMGVDTVVLTPHFYADENCPARFLERRSRAWDRLREQLEHSEDGVLTVPRRELSRAIGQRRCNLDYNVNYIAVFP